MGQFRDRMDEELRIRGYSANTRECYLRGVHNFVCHFMRPPDQLTLAHTRLRVSDIDRQRMVIRIEQGKGRKDRGRGPAARPCLRRQGSWSRRAVNWLWRSTCSARWR
jgi:hypothetical protein